MRSLKISMLFIGMIWMLSACDKEETLPRIEPEARGEFTDSRDGRVYRWVRYDGLDWMCSNLSYKTNTGFCEVYQMKLELGGETNADLLEKHGYLYDYETALAACPEGWRLPTDEDWQRLEKALGMSQQDAGRSGWRGSYTGELLQQGEEGTGIGLQADGFYSASHSTGLSSKYRLLGAYGLFWTATPAEESGFVWFRKIAGNSAQSFREKTMESNGLSVRCVREAREL